MVLVMLPLVQSAYKRENDYILVKGAEEMRKESEQNTGTFIVKILERQNATWQGKITWVEEQKEQYFRSALELLKLIDGALDSNSVEIEGGSHEK